MTTEREYREWQKKRQKYQQKQKSKSNFTILLVLGIILLSAWYAWQENKQEINSFLEQKIPKLMQLIEEANKKFDLIIKDNEQPQGLNF